MNNHNNRHNPMHNEEAFRRTKAQNILANLSPEEAGAVMTALYDYGYNNKSEAPDPHHVRAIAKGISHAALAGELLPTRPGNYH